MKCGPSDLIIDIKIKNCCLEGYYYLNFDKYRNLILLMFPRNRIKVYYL